jgi:hypothetical protein
MKYFSEGQHSDLFFWFRKFCRSSMDAGDKVVGLSDTENHAFKKLEN